MKWVKFVAKAIIGTIVIVVAMSLLIELINVQLYSSLLKSNITLGIKKSCEYFGQETYKREDDSIGKGNVDDIVGNNGEIAVRGDFYNVADTSMGIYNSLYGTSEYTKFQTQNMGKWETLDLMYKYKNGYSLSKENKELAKYYTESMMTALNIGVAYLDRETVASISRWNVVKLLSSGKPELIILDEGEPYVRSRGYKIYYNTLDITKIEYKVYDLLNGRDVIEFKRLTNINADDLEIEGEEDERRYVCVAGIKYTVDASYEGITPLRHLISFVANNRVVGYDEKTAREGKEELNEDKGSMRGGGYDNITDTAVNGNILYYIVR